MSLKAFHIFFISLSTVLALGFATWEIKGYLADGSLSQLMTGVLSIGAAIGLVVYGFYFMKKLKHVRLI